MSEEWRPVVGWEGLYEVSDMGRVRSLDRLAADGHRIRKGKVLKAVPNGSKGYPHVIMSDIPRKQGKHVHRLVMEAFVGPCPDGQEVCHNNSVNTDVRLANLRYDTRVGNARDRMESGHDPHAARPACSAGHPYVAGNFRWQKYINASGNPGVYRLCKVCHNTRRRKAAA